MKLWKRAAGALKDRNSLLAASLKKRTSFRNPDLEAAIIKATSHDEKNVDYRNVHRVFKWIRMSPVTLKPLYWALTKRMQRTKSWVVALKGLMLMHGVFCLKVPILMNGIGRLPFDLSNFSDRHSRLSEVWGFNAFVRSYFAFLDQRSTLLSEQDKQYLAEEPVVQELVKLQKWQSLLDMLLQIRPLADNMKMILILEAMDCVIIEIFEIYSRICSGISKVLKRIYSAGKLEAAMALQIIHKATLQGEELSLYFEFCMEFGVLNANEFPKVTQIPEEDIRDLERIINGVNSEVKYELESDVDHNKANVVVEPTWKEKENLMKTIITDKWEVFDEELNANVKTSADAATAVDPISATSLDLLPLVPVDEPAAYNYKIPDLISF